MSEGWVKLSRQLRVHWLWNGERFSKGQAWVDLLLLASHADHVVPMGNSLIPVKRAQVLTSQTRLAAKWLWTRKSVNAFLTLLKRDNQVDIRTSKGTETGYTLIMIKNYEKFQQFVSSGNNHSESIGGDIGEPIRGTSEEHPRYIINKGEEGKEDLACDSAPAGRLTTKGRLTTTSPHVKPLIDHFHASFVARFHSPPPLNRAKCGAIAKKLLAGRTLEEAKWLVTEHLSNPPDFFEEKNLYGLEHVLASAQTLLARRAKLKGETPVSSPGQRTAPIRNQDFFMCGCPKTEAIAAQVKQPYVPCPHGAEVSS